LESISTIVTKVLCCCMTMPIHILLPTVLQHSISYTLRPRIALMLPCQTIICLVPICCCFAVTMRWSTLGLHLAENIFLWRHTKICARLGQVCWKSSGTVLKNYALVSYVFLFCQF
jgi:hypothetical protein